MRILTETWLHNRALGLYYNHYVSPSVRPWSVKILTWYIVQPLGLHYNHYVSLSFRMSVRGQLV